MAARLNSPGAVAPVRPLAAASGDLFAVGAEPRLIPTAPAVAATVTNAPTEQLTTVAAPTACPHDCTCRGSAGPYERPLRLVWPNDN